MMNKIISLGIVLLVGNKILSQTDKQLYPNKPKSFWWHIKDLIKAKKYNNLQRKTRH